MNAEARELEFSPQLATLERLEAARDNVLTAVDFALSVGDHEAAMRLCADMSLFWQLHGRHGESLACVRRVLGATPADTSPARARLLCAAGQLGFYTMSQPEGYGSVETTAAIEMARALGDDLVLGRALGMQGMLAVFGPPEAAFAGLAEARAAAERAGDPYGQSAASFYAAFGWVFGLDRPDLAAPHLDALRADAASPVWEAWGWFVEGMAAWKAGRLWRAVDLLGRANELGWAVGDPVQESWCAFWLAETYLCLGEWDAAEDVIARSEGWMDRSSWGRYEMVASRRVVMGLARGDFAAAGAAFRLVEGPCRTMGMPMMTLEMAVVQARLALADEDLATAHTCLAEATAIGEVIGTPWYLAVLADLAGRIATADGDESGAEDAYHRMLALCLDHGFRGQAATALEELARLAATTESHTEAVRLLGAAEGLRHATGQVRARPDEPAWSDTLATCTAALGPELAASLRSAGEALDLAEAAAYATRARTERKRPSSGWAALTPTELAVVDLVAQGLTNPQIAERLFITAGTTKVHLTHVYAKLGLSNRTQLATAAVARGRPSAG
ncbi:MAG: helix-turn-helix transcriptional regulator [Sporichthyaceae bacterium]